MGQNCCVAARAKSLPNRNNHEVSTYRNVRQSPTWSFRWDNRTHIEDIMETRTTFSHHNNGNATLEVKSAVGVEDNGLSDGESPPKAFDSSQWRKPFRSGGLEDTKLIVADQAASSNSALKGNLLHKSSILPNASSTAKPFLPVKVQDPSSSRTLFIPSDPTSTGKATRSPGFQLHRQISDSRIPSPEGSHGGSSDGWSMRTFSELVASSRRERRSFDDENLTATGKIVGPSLDLNEDIPPIPHACGICSKSLDDLPACSFHYGHPRAAVLCCGHVFHAECLEGLTPEAEVHDPPCPVCDRRGWKPMKRKDGEAESSSGRRRRNGKGAIMGASSSMKGSFGRPFLRRHLSLGGPRPARSASENETSKKKWFWPKYTRE